MYFSHNSLGCYYDTVKLILTVVVTSNTQTWISLIWRLNSPKSVSNSGFLWSRGSYGFFLSAEYMCWNRFAIASIPSILDSDNTENVSRVLRTSMILETKKLNGKQEVLTRDQGPGKCMALSQPQIVGAFRCSEPSRTSWYSLWEPNLQFFGELLLF